MGLRHLFFCVKNFARPNLSSLAVDEPLEFGFPSTQGQSQQAYCFGAGQRRSWETGTGRGVRIWHTRLTKLRYSYDIHPVWTPDGNGGDRKSCLFGEGGFDNGHCYQISSSLMSIARQVEFPHPAQVPQGVDIWCSLNITVPGPLSSGTLTLYWIWEWPVVQQNEDVDKFYTTCMNPHRTQLGSQ